MTRLWLRDDEKVGLCITSRAGWQWVKNTGWFVFGLGQYKGREDAENERFVNSRVSEGSRSMDVGRSMDTPDMGPSMIRSSTGRGLPRSFLNRLRACLCSSSLLSFWNGGGGGGGLGKIRN